MDDVVLDDIHGVPPTARSDSGRDLRDHEAAWKLSSELLERKGYRLRPRYRRSSTPSPRRHVDLSGSADDTIALPQVGITYERARNYLTLCDPLSATTGGL